jgi:hypothetical protein
MGKKKHPPGPECWHRNRNEIIDPRPQASGAVIINLIDFPVGFSAGVCQAHENFSICSVEQFFFFNKKVLKWPFIRVFAHFFSTQMAQTRGVF